MLYLKYIFTLPYMNAKLQKFLEVLGLWKPVVVTALASPLEKLKSQLAAAKDDAQKSDFREKALLEARSLFIQQQTKRDGIVEIRPEHEQIFLEMIQQIELLAFLLTDGKVGAESSPEYERLLEELAKSLKLISKPADEPFAQLHSYIKNYEDQILLSEAQGKYRFGISETDKWILLPILSTLENNPPKKNQAQKEVDKWYRSWSVMDLLKLNTDVPFRAISMVDVEEQVEGKRLVLLKTSGKYYWKIF